uniref:LisH domain-containing protein n=1 Tax=Heterorhabditis bacteriophora TaxID=37862 RepID=A0A1I7W8P7_HETBA
MFHFNSIRLEAVRKMLTYGYLNGDIGSDKAKLTAKDVPLLHPDQHRVDAYVADVVMNHQQFSTKRQLAKTHYPTCFPGYSIVRLLTSEQLRWGQTLGPRLHNHILAKLRRGNSKQFLLYGKRRLGNAMFAQEQIRLLASHRTSTSFILMKRSR